MAYEMAPAYAGRPYRPLRGLLAFVGAVLLVCCVGASGLGVWTFQSVKRAEGPAREAADGYLRALTAGDFPGAYRHLCGGTRRRWGPEGFADRAREQPKIDHHTITDVHITAENLHLKGTVTAEVTWQSGVVATQVLPMLPDGDTWQVCGDPF